MREAGYSDSAIEAFDGYEAVGCARCAHTGYRGRTGIFEVLSIDDRIRELLLDRFPAKAIEDAARENGMVTLSQSAFERVRQGVISLAEAARITSTD